MTKLESQAPISPAPSLTTQNDQRQLLRHGAIMLLLGLLSGFTTLFAAVPAAALSAHLIGAVQGAILIGLAGAWPALHASPRILSAIKYTALIGTYTNWIGVQLAAFWSAKRAFVVNADKFSAQATPWQENIVFVLLNLSALVILSCILIVIATRRQ